MQREDAATPMDASPTAPVASSPSPPASAAAGQEPVVRPSTRIGSGSPGSSGASGSGGATNGGARYLCQVDGCRADLTSLKGRYFRRHKVCETHCKTPVVLVAGRMQRFCQMCSRFQPLAEFDEYRRTCRRRLARYHQQRRRMQLAPADVARQLLVPGNQENEANRRQDIVNLITVIAGLQGDGGDGDGDVHTRGGGGVPNGEGRGGGEPGQGQPPAAHSSPPAPSSTSSTD